MKTLYKPTDAEIFEAANTISRKRKIVGAEVFTADQVRAWITRQTKKTVDGAHVASVMREMFIDILNDDRTYNHII